MVEPDALLSLRRATAPPGFARAVLHRCYTGRAGPEADRLRLRRTSPSCLSAYPAGLGAVHAEVVNALRLVIALYVPSPPADTPDKYTDGEQEGGCSGFQRQDVAGRPASDR
jgi:hypothetical protein